MKFSVVIPMYNSEKFIARAIKSVLNQTYKNYEIIVVNDGSTDNGLAVAGSFAKKNNNIKIISQENKLVGAARNLGIKQSTNNHIAFLDSDDEYLPDFLETISVLIYEYPEAGAYAAAYRVQKSDKSFIPKYSALPRFPWKGIVPSYYKSALHYHPLLPSAVVIKRDVFEDTGYFAEGVKIGEDIDCWARLASKYDIAFSSRVCVVYHRDNVVSLSTEKTLNHDTKVETTLENIIKNKQYRTKDEYYIKEWYNKIHLDTALKYIKDKNKAKAKEHLDKVETKLFKFKKIKLKLKMLFMSTETDIN
ncbi:MAG: glycosyltransferase family 2 protein [Endomicrobium sp.]|jgi:glycosyltransferase involved in cell wall biosynthesis|nr:glycosyltransferase family 2 protein [Endomicrobium sp.]